MGKRGPKPKGKLSVVNPTVKKRPRPPFGMVQRARNLFKRVVGENRADAFDSESVVMLATFCNIENQNYLATKKVEEYGAIIQNEVCVPSDLTTWEDSELSKQDKQYTYVENPWYKIMKETASSLCTISAKLRASGIKTAKTKGKIKEVPIVPARPMFKG